MRRIVVAALVFWLAARPGAAAPPAADLAPFAFEPHPGALLPLSVRLVDDAGHSVALGDFFDGRPVVLVLDYLRCRSLCGLTLTNLITALDALPLEASRDYRILAISIDPRDGPAELASAEAKYRALYHHKHGADGIGFLAGAAPAVTEIADAIGFPYRYDRATDQYIHPAGFVLASPDGRISRYLFGIGADAATLQTGLAAAARDKAISPLDRLFLLCHIEGAPLGRFTVPVMAGLMFGNVAAGLAAAAVFAAVRRRRRG